MLGEFFAGLRDARILGARSLAGRVLVPPAEYDPDTGEAVRELVEVGQVGAVTTWCWIDAPRPQHPFARPFAWGLIKLDGADTAMLHVVDAGSADRMKTGMRVVARWRAERKGEMRDLACFDPEVRP